MSANKLKREIAKEKDVVRRDHLQRQLAGPDAIAHMTNKVNEKQVARDKVTDAVSKIGRANQLEAIADGKRSAAKAKVKEAGLAKKAADIAKAKAKEAEVESEEFNELAAIRQYNADLEARIVELEKGK